LPFRILKAHISYIYFKQKSNILLLDFSGLLH
jgi:hypothetical protein